MAVHAETILRNGTVWCGRAEGSRKQSRSGADACSRPARTPRSRR